MGSSWQPGSGIFLVTSRTISRLTPLNKRPVHVPPGTGSSWPPSLGHMWAALMQGDSFSLGAGISLPRMPSPHNHTGTCILGPQPICSPILQWPKLPEAKDGFSVPCPSVGRAQSPVCCRAELTLCPFVLGTAQGTQGPSGGHSTLHPWDSQHSAL